MLKRRCAAALAVCLLLVLAACGGKRESTVRVGVALYRQDDTFITSLSQYLQQAVLEEERARGVKINLNVVDGRGSQTTQNEQVDQFLDKGYDVICVNIVDRTAAAVIIDKAQGAGVPVVFFNREPVEEDLNRWEYAYYVGTRADEAGRIQGGLVLDAWRAGPAALDRNGDGVLQYVMLEGEPGHQDSLLRTEHSVRTLTAAGVSMEKLSNHAADWQRGPAKIRMQRWLEELGDAIEVVFANNDDMALGAIDALASTPREHWPLIVGVDATAPALEAVAAGQLYGTVHNDGRGQAQAMLDLTLALWNGEDPGQAVDLAEGHYVWLPYRQVTLENLDEFLEK